VSIEDRFDISLVAKMALKEKQIQQNYRPIIAVHKWFARRPGTLFRALTLAEFGERPLADIFFKPNDFPGCRIADPFMGGGTPLIEANRVGCDVAGFDINPMASWIVREELEYLDVQAYQEMAQHLLEHLRNQIGHLYLTDCPLYGDADVHLKYCLWVKVIDCAACGKDIDLFPGYLIAKDTRHPKNVLICPCCGNVNEVEDRNIPGRCQSCQARLQIEGPAGRGRCKCPHCSHENVYPRKGEGPLRHRPFAIEYFNHNRNIQHKGRFFKKPDEKDLVRIEEAERILNECETNFVPNQPILPGDETDRLHRWGYNYYREMFSDRQLLGLELSCRFIASVKDERIRHALATNLSDLLRYQNLLCRYDTWALKSLDIFSVHGFPVGHVQCESNLLGIVNKKGTNVGSGGWTNIIDKYSKAKIYCDAPFEMERQGKKNVKVPVTGEWIGDRSNGGRPRHIDIHCADATAVDLKPNSLDAVFTDPPYFGNVQYGELMDFCYVWLRRLVGENAEGFWRPSTRTEEELTGNVTRSRGLAQFTEGLSRVYRHMAEALKPGAPLTFTYHHNKIDAYYAVGVAILDAGLTCSASLPCPAEMSGSIHIHGTSSSIVDTVFVCRYSGKMPRKWIFNTSTELEKIINRDLVQIAEGSRKPTIGDTRCIIYGHLTRMAIWNLKKDWNIDLTTEKKLDLFAKEIHSFCDPEDLMSRLQRKESQARPAPGPMFSEKNVGEGSQDVVAF